MKMICPHCKVEVTALFTLGEAGRILCPWVCGTCTEVSLYLEGNILRFSDEQMEKLKTTRVWAEAIEPARALLRQKAAMRRAMNN